MAVLRYFFSWKGRMGRRNFIVSEIGAWFLCIYFVGAGGIGREAAVDRLVFYEESIASVVGDRIGILVVGIFILFLGVIFIWSMNFAWTMRRLHDVGMSGKWVLLLFAWNIFVQSFVPKPPKNMTDAVTGLLLTLLCVAGYIYLCFKKGDDGENEYGLPPM